MKRKILFQLFAFGLLLQFSACNIPDSDALEGSAPVTADGQWISYLETQCADPWGYCNKDPEKTVCVKEYLEKNGVTVLEATVTGKVGEGAVCTACQCQSGRTFKVKIQPQDVDKALQLGFKKI